MKYSDFRRKTGNLRIYDHIRLSGPFEPDDEKKVSIWVLSDYGPGYVVTRKKKYIYIDKIGGISNRERFRENYVNIAQLYKGNEISEPHMATISKKKNIRKHISRLGIIKNPLSGWCLIYDD